ncbi:MAG: LON peptidase substrate-binding domain-containing protein, partial [Candidatus Tectomicrobia bacterium]|nr:LON peptidase substrate-binding domain-containing protein [Candidatus Tectomicrobia bacterium]
MSNLPEQTQEKNESIQIPDHLPLLPVRDLVVFPYMVVPLFVGRKSSVSALNQALSENRLMVLTAQKESSLEHPRPDDLYTMGTAVSILRVLKLPDGRVKIMVQGLARAQIASFVQLRPFFKVKINIIEDPVEIREKSLKKEALMRNIRDQLEKIVSLGRLISPDILVVAENVNSSGRLADLVASNLGLSIEDSQQILETLNPDDRLKKAAELLNKEYELLQMQYKIQTEAKEEMTKTQKE